MSSSSEALLDHIADLLKFISGAQPFWFLLNTSYDHGCHLANHFRLDPDKYRLLSSPHCAALLSSCRASWLSHHLSPSSHCATLSSSFCASWLLHCLSPSSHCATLSSTRQASLLPHHLSLSSQCAPHRPLVLSSRRLVVPLPLDAPPSRHLVILSSCRAASHCLIAPAGCCAIISCRPLVAPPSRPLIMLAGCCVACPCTTLSSSRRSPSPTP